MESLSQNWITEKHIDLEYKKYILLAYLQQVESRFEETYLYPYMSELIMHYRNVIDLKKNKENLYSNFSSRLSGIDLNAFKLIYDKLSADDELMQQLESIIDFSIPQFEKYLNEGKRIYEFVEKHIQFNPVGIIPIRISEGYLFLNAGQSKETRVYSYEVTLIENPDDRYRAIHTAYICSYEKGITTTYENIKSELLRINKLLPNPATYAFECELQIPVEATFLPIAKRMMMRYVAVKGL